MVKVVFCKIEKWCFGFACEILIRAMCAVNGSIWLGHNFAKVMGNRSMRSAVYEG
jgi:hypothetical protein